MTTTAKPPVRLELVHGHHYRVVTTNGRVHMTCHWDRERFAFTLQGEKGLVVIALDHVERVAPIRVDRRGPTVIDWEREATLHECYTERLTAPGHDGGIHG